MPLDPDAAALPGGRVECPACGLRSTLSAICAACAMAVIASREWNPVLAPGQASDVADSEADESRNDRALQRGHYRVLADRERRVAAHAASGL